MTIHDWRALIGPAYEPSTSATRYEYWSPNPQTATTLAAGIDGDDTTITVDDATYLDSRGAVWVGPNGAGEGWEYVRYSGKSGASLTGCVREPSTTRDHSGSHTAGATVRQFWEITGDSGTLRLTEEINDNLAATANTFKLHYITQSGGGSFRYRIDSGSWTTVSTDAAAAYATIEIGALATSSHVLSIEVTAAGSAGVALIGVECLLSANGVRVNWAGNGGAQALSFSQVDETLWRDAIAALTPDTVVILLGTNDHSSNVIPATFATRMTTIIDRIQAELPLTDIVLLAPADNGLTGKTYTVAAYVAELRNLAVSQTVAMLDTYMNFGAYADGNARGMYANSSHPSLAGYDAISQLLVDRLQL